MYHTTILRKVFAFFSVTLLSACTPVEDYDVLIRNAAIYDGTGSEPFQGDIAIRGDTIAAVGTLNNATALNEINAEGMAIAPGFINMLSWATESLIQDGKSESNIRQGVTLEVFGEGSSMGPLNEKMKREMSERQGEIQYEVSWRTLSGYLEYLTKRGVSPNVASFVGATTVRVHVIDHENRPPTPDELASMSSLVRQAMEEGALGLGSSLIYAPAFYASTEELTTLAKVASEYGGMYISHLRSEGTRLLEATEELITITRTADISSEIYHLKAAGKDNWPKLDEVINRIETVRTEGLDITANIYTYTAGATGLDAAMPPWVQEGGHKAWVKRLKDPAVRQRLKSEIATPTQSWENLYLAAGSPNRILLMGFRNRLLKPLAGKTLAEVAAARGKSPIETAMDLVIQDDSRVSSVYFLMSEENLRKKIALPWISFGSDAASLSPQGVFLNFHPHPRAYGNFARLLGKYVRGERIIPLEEAIRRLTSQPATNLKILGRGYLRTGYFADVIIFDPKKIQDYATYKNPHLYSSGMIHVFVNGIQVLREGRHTGATPGRVIRGPGWIN